MDIPEQGTVVDGIGNEIVILSSGMIGIMVCAMLVKILGIGSTRTPSNLHPDTVSAVRTTRREMGVARASEAEPSGHVENCPVCLDIIQHSVQTNCGHKFCAQCVLEYWRHDQWPRPARCPICRTEVGQWIHVLVC